MIFLPHMRYGRKIIKRKKKQMGEDKQNVVSVNYQSVKQQLINGRCYLIESESNWKGRNYLSRRQHKQEGNRLLSWLLRQVTRLPVVLTSLTPFRENNKQFVYLNHFLCLLLSLLFSKEEEASIKKCTTLHIPTCVRWETSLPLLVGNR